MFVNPEDMKILGTLRDLRDLYAEKFGEFFPYFNYADFGYDEHYERAILEYKAKLEQALREGKPYHIKSKLRPPITTEEFDAIDAEMASRPPSKPQKTLTFREINDICSQLSPEELEGMTLEKLKELYGHY